MRWREQVVEELQSLAKRIADNIARNGQTASGRSAKSLEVRQEDDTFLLLGRKAFHTLERGVPPLGDKIKTKSLAGILYRWSNDKRISFADERERWSFAFALAHKIKERGTRLYGDGGREDVYSSEIPATIQGIEKRLGTLFRMEIEKNIMDYADKQQ
jgi:hypothetical protein